MGKKTADRSLTSVLKQKDSLQWTNVLGVRISAVNLKSATGFIQKAIEEGRREYVCVRDAHGVVRCQDDPELRSIHNRAFLVTPDGMPLVWALKHAGHSESDRVYGPDLMLSVFEAGTSKGIRHFLYGATPETLQHLQARLLAKFPEAEIAGSYAPPFHKLSPQEEADIADRLNRSGADIIWVGLSSPKQELWMARMRDRLDASMLIGVGAAFDFHAGLKRQAPRFIQRSGFEWAFRLLCEPRRLWRRYALVVPAFISLTAFQRLGLRKFPIEDEVFGSSSPKSTAVKV
ncbi:WecB/TagA/CpsF family glycosyltransferase [Rhizobium bangladeshense]|uniref:WecB/TagA/CpsF family glycosyltransferase n=1 Tax=Rhizobium bangladeshense TaxID=1138189 RepID=A0ABS7LJ72_9HYPH|nr:WecB/TagA/CpsF family glycosyltransferase [Rhizobium bangladeshense]MBX4869872.1 WecB/TagA/CpsF family glycosyltransferase [Rhizobium bangladeshense]MBX4876820.1 WecB/TagA/CpsF family glycosyltransferase [Rhizobium bangladeshense]MBX4885619.1 WecB/TagA/CpsF family glycosyltransferase [Rhizobium bangladeshense]MBX4891117.1 WecB/TagA/CpsF family glycosyltransferase [Rhizobium bangladeshense]MBX4918068.1 WecB/TagA/CpsF family glycosyltransferase [Rhizobium bangladeshense]